MKRYLFLLFAVMLLGLAVDSAQAANPTQQARYIAFRSVAATSIDLSFTRGNGAHRIVVVSTTDFPVNPADPNYKAPTNTVTYTQGATKGSFTSVGASTIGADGHVVYNSNEAGNTATERTLLITGLTPGTTYYIHIFEYNTVANPEYCINRGTVNNPANTYTAPMAPTITQGADLLSPNGFLAQWDEPAGIVDLYDFQLKDAFNGGGSNYWDDPGYADFNAPANDYEFIDLTANHEYSYRIRAVKGYRYSAWTGWHNVKTMPENIVTSSNGSNEACAYSTVTYTVNMPTGVSMLFGEWFIDGLYSEMNPSAEPWTNQNIITWDAADEVEITTSYTDLLYGMDGDVPSALNNRGKIGAEPDHVDLQNQYFVDVINAPQPITVDFEAGWNLTPCQGAEVLYTVVAQPGMHFQWLVNDEPVGLDQNSYTLTVPAPGEAPLELSVFAYVATCSTEVYSRNLVIRPLPTTPVSFTVLETLCENSTVTFTTPAGAEGETFNWTFPADWTPNTITEGSNSVEVIVGSVTGNVTVAKHNACGNSEAYSEEVVPTLLPYGFEILAEVTTTCEGDEMTFTVVPPDPNDFPDATFAWEAANGSGEFSGTGWTAIGEGTTFTIPAGQGDGFIRLFSYNGTCGSLDDAIVVYGNPLPTGGVFAVDNPAINMPTVCAVGEMTSYNYVVSGVTTATSYEWSVPEGWTIIGLDNGPSIDVIIDNTLEAPVDVQLSVRAYNGTCPAEDLLTYDVHVNPLPFITEDAAITGPETVCEGQTSVQYTIAGVNNATGYFWTLPDENWVIQGDETGATITINLMAGAGSGEVKALPANDCGDALNEVTFGNVTLNLLPVDYVFTVAPEATCVGEVVTYTVNGGTEATSYDWDVVGDGWTFVVDEVNPYTIHATAGTATGTITCTPMNGECGQAGGALTANTTVTPLPSSVIINGSESVCKSTAGFEYTVTGTNITSQEWQFDEASLTAGWSITSDADLSTITVTSGSTAGTLTVFTSNGECPADPVSITINVNDPPAGTSIGATTPVCEGSEQIYTFAGLTNTNESTEFNWDAPADWTFVSQDDVNHTATYIVGQTSGVVSCYPANGDCVGTEIETVNIVVNLLPAGYTITDYPASVCAGSTQSYTVSDGNGLATEFFWTLPDGWDFNPAGITQTTATINVTVGTNGGEITCRPLTETECEQEIPATATVTVNPRPNGYTMTTAPTPVCEGSTQTYAVTGGEYAVTYNWILPDGWSWDATDLNHTDATAIVVVGTAGGDIRCMPVSAHLCEQQTVASASIVVNPRAVGYTVTTAPTPVCEGSTQSYTVGGGSFGATYNWTLPAGWSWDATDLNHTDATAIVVVGANGGTISCTPVSANGCAQATAATAVLAVNPRPVGYTITTAPSPVCEASTQSYVVSGGNFGATYNWTLPAGWSWDATDLNHTDATAIVVVGDAGGTISCVPVSANGCTQATAASTLIMVRFLPTGIISGTTPVCANSNNNTYSIVEGTDITDYSWRVEGEGWSGTSTSPTFTPTAGTANGTVYCTIYNGPCTIAELSFPVAVTPTATATSISGNLMPCRGAANVTYTVQNPANITSITWTVPVESGWSIVSQEGNSVTVNVGTAAGTIYAQLYNGTCAGQNVSLVIESLNDVPANAGNIQGSTAPCLGTEHTYSVTNVEGVGYEWNYPETWTNVSGQGTYQLTATVNGNGTVTVTPSNTCGNGTVSQTTITTTTIPSPTSAIEGMSIVTPPGQYSYSVINVPGVTYTWTAPASWGEPISGQGTNAVTYNVTTSSASGYVKVTPSNACGVCATTTERYVTVNVGPPAQPSLQATNIGFSGTTCSQVNLTWTNGDGNGRMVIAKQGASPNNPTDLVRYNADSRFGRAATQIGTTGTYVVYKYMPGDPGTGNSCTVINLARGLQYYFKVIEFNYVDYNGLENGYNYNPNPAYLNPRSMTTLSACKEVEATTNPYAEIGLFTARSANGNGYLAWNTQYEQNILGYEVSRLCISDKEENFTTVSSFETNLDLVAENMNANRDYKLTDNGVVTGKKYLYRLSYVGADGSKNDVSEQTLFIDGTTANSGALTISDVKPNPVKESVNFDVTTSEETEARFEIINMNGEVVASTTARVKGTFLMNMPLDVNVPSGSYMLKVTAGTETAVTRFVVVK